jgi:hypothetical protein
MKHRIRVLSFIFIIAGVTGCVTPPYNPFVVSRSDIYEKVDTLAMLPLQCPDFDRKEEVSARYEALITERLVAAGFKVIPSKESASIRNTMIEQLGGIFDPVTGQVAEAKRQAVSDYLVQEMNAKFDIDAFITPRIDQVGAQWSGNNATWDGATDATTGKTGFWASLGNSNMSGTIPAMSLVVVLRDKTDSEGYYVGRGGIQLLAHYGETFTAGFTDIPKSEWFVDGERDVTAVTIALTALVNEPELDK